MGGEHLAETLAVQGAIAEVTGRTPDGLNAAIGQGDGSIREVDPLLAATCLQMTAQSFVFSARVVEGQDVLPELRHLLDSYLRP